MRNARIDERIPTYQGGDPTREDLRKKVVEVELKAKKMSYLKSVNKVDVNNLLVNPMAKIPVPKLPVPKFQPEVATEEAASGV